MQKNCLNVAIYATLVALVALVFSNYALHVDLIGFKVARLCQFF